MVKSDILSVLLHFPFSICIVPENCLGTNRADNCIGIPISRIDLLFAARAVISI